MSREPSAEGMRYMREANRLTRRITKPREAEAKLSFLRRHALRRANDAGVTYMTLAAGTGLAASVVNEHIQRARAEFAKGWEPTPDGEVPAEALEELGLVATSS